MENNLKRTIVVKARLVYGLVEVLKDDISRAREYASEYDINKLNESLREAKYTLQALRDTFTDLEYDLYLLEHKRGTDA